MWTKKNAFLNPCLFPDIGMHIEKFCQISTSLHLTKDVAAKLSNILDLTIRN